MRRRRLSSRQRPRSHTTSSWHGSARPETAGETSILSRSLVRLEPGKLLGGPRGVLDEPASWRRARQREWAADARPPVDDAPDRKGQRLPRAVVRSPRRNAATWRLYALMAMFPKVRY